MYYLNGEKVVLRDFIEEDIPQRILWETEETEWQLWDAPWEYEGQSESEKEISLGRYIETMKEWVKRYESMSPTERRTGFQITADGIYIGWCNSYRIDEDYNYDPNGRYCAIGIDIPSLSARGKGYAIDTLVTFIDYLLQKGEKSLYTQTWSGNTRMIRLAGKLGFEECRRKKGIRQVRGKRYDGLTFVLDQKRYQKFRSGLKKADPSL